MSQNIQARFPREGQTGRVSKSQGTETPQRLFFSDSTCLCPLSPTGRHRKALQTLEVVQPGEAHRSTGDSRGGRAGDQCTRLRSSHAAQGCRLSQVPGQQPEQKPSNANSRKVLGEHWSPFPLSPENKARDASRGVQVNLPHRPIREQQTLICRQTLPLMLGCVVWAV